MDGCDKIKQNSNYKQSIILKARLYWMILFLCQSDTRYREREINESGARHLRSRSKAPPIDIPFILRTAKKFAKMLASWNGRIKYSNQQQPRFLIFFQFYAPRVYSTQILLLTDIKRYSEFYIYIYMDE